MTTLAILPMLGTWELVAICVVAVLLFGTRLPKLARSVGSTVVEFKKGVQGIEDDVKDIKKGIEEA
jgi:sec-independent protein translocase protein TatA